MSEIDYEYYTLEDCIQGSELIVIVEKGDPFQTIKEIPIGPEDGKYPPFKKVTYHFVVNEVLYNSDEEDLTDMEIQVVSANWDSDLEMHKLYHLQNILESPIYEAYETTVDLFAEETLILFLYPLNASENKYILTYEFAYESVLKLGEVEVLIEQIHDTEPHEEFIEEEIED